MEIQQILLHELKNKIINNLNVQNAHGYDLITEQVL